MIALFKLQLDYHNDRVSGYDLVRFIDNADPEKALEEIKAVIGAESVGMFCFCEVVPGAPAYEPIDVERPKVDDKIIFLEAGSWTNDFLEGTVLSVIESDDCVDARQYKVRDQYDNIVMITADMILCVHNAAQPA